MEKNYDLLVTMENSKKDDIGKVGDLAMRLRIQLTASKQTPDLYSMMQVMGKEEYLQDYDLNNKKLADC